MPLVFQDPSHPSNPLLRHPEAVSWTKHLLGRDLTAHRLWPHTALWTGFLRPFCGGWAVPMEPYSLAGRTVWWTLGNGNDTRPGPLLEELRGSVSRGMQVELVCLDDGA